MLIFTNAMEISTAGTIKIIMTELYLCHPQCILSYFELRSTVISSRSKLNFLSLVFITILRLWLNILYITRKCKLIHLSEHIKFKAKKNV
jgi:hypothetical protein